MRFPQVGEDFGDYSITGELGRGGMGVVFSATQPRVNNRPVAVKVLGQQWASDGEYRARFQREATALASLDSPHVIHIYDHGELDGCLFITTQLVSGGSLRSWLDKNGPLSLPAALDLVAQVTSALADAHAIDVIHRDIKPSNVLIRRAGDGDLFAYLCDFGIVAVTDPNHTRTAGMLGTFGYVAPERHEGRPATVASDIYAVGCLLWATLTGAAPYGGTDVQAAIRHMREPVPQIRGSGAASEAVNQILARTMAKRPDDRYDTAYALRADLLRASRLAADLPEGHHPALPGEGRPGTESVATAGPDRTRVVTPPAGAGNVRSGTGPERPPVRDDTRVEAPKPSGGVLGGPSVMPAGRVAGRLVPPLLALAGVLVCVAIAVDYDASGFALHDDTGLLLYNGGLAMAELAAAVLVARAAYRGLGGGLAIGLALGVAGSYVATAQSYLGDTLKASEPAAGFWLDMTSYVALLAAAVLAPVSAFRLRRPTPLLFGAAAVTSVILIIGQLLPWGRQGNTDHDLGGVSEFSGGAGLGYAITLLVALMVPTAAVAVASRWVRMGVLGGLAVTQLGALFAFFFYLTDDVQAGAAPGFFIQFVGLLAVGGLLVAVATERAPSVPGVPVGR